MSCPTDGTLQDMLAASLPAGNAESVRSHVATCSDCQKRLDQMTEVPNLTSAKSTAVSKIEGLSPLMSRLKQLNETPKPAMKMLDDDDVELTSPIWKTIALVACLAAMILAGGWAFDHFWHRRNQNLAAADAIQNKLMIQTLMDGLYQSTIANVDLNDSKTLEVKRDAAKEIILYYQAQFQNLANDRSRARETADAAFRVAMLTSITGPDTATAAAFNIARQWCEALPAEQKAERIRTCCEQLVLNYSKVNNWRMIEWELRYLLSYWQQKLNENPTDGPTRRSLVKLFVAIADASQRNSDLNGAIGAYRFAVELMDAALKLEPQSPFLKKELASLYQAFGDLLKQNGQTEEAAQVYDQAKALQDKSN